MINHTFMLYRWIILSGLLFWGFALPHDAMGQKPPTESLLWRLSKPGMPDSYVLGTAHFACEAPFLTAPVLLEKIKAAQTLYLELDLNDPSLGAKMMKALALDTIRLSNLMGTGFAAADSAYRQLTGIPLQSFDAFHPFVALGWMVQKTLPCNNPVQMEMVLLQAAKKFKVPTQGLETLEEQLAAVLALPIKAQAEELEQGLKEPQKMKEEMKHLQALYQQKSIQGLYDLVKAGSGGLSGWETALLTRRNQNWAEKAKSFLPKGVAFIAVGAAHLGGPQGILQLLRNNGWQTTPIALP